VTDIEEFVAVQIAVDKFMNDIGPVVDQRVDDILKTDMEALGALDQRSWLLGINTSLRFLCKSVH
jgi:hypothetical protein